MIGMKCRKLRKILDCGIYLKWRVENRMPSLYGVNQFPYGDEQSLLIDDEDNSNLIDLAIRTVPRFGIFETEAKKLAEEILSIVRDHWNRFCIYAF